MMGLFGLNEIDSFIEKDFFEGYPVKNKPLIFDFAKNSTQAEETVPYFKYNYEKNLNVIQSQDKKEIPFILMQNKNQCTPHELLTKTRQDREADDDDFAELITKTATNREQDDDDFVYYQ
ncbi:hypothetical protein GMJAKD_01530 [Candidatus Electrothrix aarhusensis]